MKIEMPTMRFWAGALLGPVQVSSDEHKLIEHARARAND